MTKTIDTLVEDIYGLFDPDVDHEISEDNLEKFATTLKDVLRSRLGANTHDDINLRFSNLGRPDRQTWYAAHPEGGKEVLRGPTYFKFLYGDVVEALLLFLAAEAGHTVEREQEEVEVEGVKGHIDAVIDGVVVDVKSASPFGYKKFKDGSIFTDDPFGYVAQLSGYADVLTTGESAAWLVADKVSGNILLAPLSTSIIADHRPGPRIDHLKKVIANEEPPERCYSPVPEGKSGNMRLPTGCSYCAYKFRCHPELRTFLYSSGPKYLTKVVKLPEVPEVVSPVLETLDDD